MEIKFFYEDEIDLAFVRTYISSVKESLEMIRKKLKDESISLEDRWEIYLQIQPFLKTDGSYMTFDSLEEHREVSWYDDFYLDRYAVKQLDKDFIEDIQDKIDEDEWVVDIDSLKEEILEYAVKGYGAFENDW